MLVKIIFIVIGYIFIGGCVAGLCDVYGDNRENKRLSYWSIVLLLPITVLGIISGIGYSIVRFVVGRFKHKNSKEK